MSVCSILFLVALALVVLGLAAYFAHRHDRSARFTERLEIRADERYFDAEHQ